MTRLALLIGLGVLGLVAVLMLPARSAHLLVSDAVAVPMQDGPMLMVSLTVRNDGPPEQVTGVSSPGAEVAMIANPGVVAAPIIVPGDGTGVFAVDGAHIMVHAQSADRCGQP